MMITQDIQIEPLSTDQYEIRTIETYNPDNLIEDYMTQDNTEFRFSAATDVVSVRNHITPNDFEYIKVIGRDYNGKVTLVRFKKDGNIYTLKSIKKAKLKEAKHIEHTKSERKILAVLHFPFIVALRFSFQTEKKLYFVMDYHNGGELFYHIRANCRFSEEQTRFYLSQIVLTLEFLHSRNIIYRDLKPENIVLDSQGYIKLTDFGLSKDNILEASGCTETFCGTPEYLAPEIINWDKYGKGVDIWCLGILAYEMLFGYPPFYDKNRHKLYKKIIFNDPDLGKSTDVKLSPEAKDLILKLLEKNQKSRINIDQVKRHPFFDGLDFSKIYEHQYTPPIIPDVKGIYDYKYIDPMMANEIAEDSMYNGISPVIMKGK